MAVAAPAPRPDGALTLRETGLAALLLGLLAAIVYGGYAREGTFVFDDWKYAGEARRLGDPGLFSLTDAFYNYGGTNQRLGGSFFFASFHSFLGESFAAHIAAGVAMSVLASLAVYAVLRRLGVPVLHAAVPCVLLLLFPWADSIRYWPTASIAAWAIVLVAACLLLNLLALDARGGRRIALHAAGSLLLVWTTLTYEAGIGLLPIFFAVYWWRAGVRAAVVRSALDLVSVVVALVITSSHQTRSEQTPTASEALDHVGTTIDQSLTLLARSVVPIEGLSRWLVLLLVAAVVVAAVVKLRGGRPELRPWLIGLGASVAVLAGGYVAFMASSSYYVPLQPGQGNRTNAMAAIGYAGAVYCLLGLAALLLLPAAARAARAPVVAAAAAAVIALGWAVETSEHAEAWERSGDLQQQALRTVGAQVPNPPPGTALAFYGIPYQSAPGVPVFSDYGDLSSALSVTFGRPLTGYVVHGATPLTCEAQAARWNGDGLGLGQADLPYQPGAVFVDVAAQRAERVTTEKLCRAVTGGFRPGALLESPDGS